MDEERNSGGAQRTGIQNWTDQRIIKTQYTFYHVFKHFSTSLSKIAITGIFASALFLCPDASAIPARQHPYTITQPDGTQLTVTMVGDERGSFLVDQSGRLVCKTKTEPIISETSTITA